jgi:hypothetical protein
MFDRLNSNCVPKIYFLKTIVLFEWVASDLLTSAPLTSAPLSHRGGGFGYADFDSAQSTGGIDCLWKWLVYKLRVFIHKKGLELLFIFGGPFYLALAG